MRRLDVFNLIPYFEGRVGRGWDQWGTRSPDVDYGALLGPLKRRPIGYFRLFGRILLDPPPTRGLPCQRSADSSPLWFPSR